MTATKQFNRMTGAGKISSSIGLLAESHSTGVLSLSDTIDGKSVEGIRKAKHPNPSPSNPNCIINTSNGLIPGRPWIFEQINVSHIRTAAMKTHGSHGPSDLYANEWIIITLFKDASTVLSNTIAKVARRIATEAIAPEKLEAYNDCRLVPLDKNSGVRRIGIGEILRRTIGRNMTKCTSQDFLELGSNKQLCLGQKSGNELVIHSLREKFEESDAEALLPDANNTLNSLNRELAMKNIEILCPPLYHATYNYSKPSALFVDQKMLSREGTTQGDPLAMARYGVAVLPLMERVENERILQRWYADDGSVAEKLEELRHVLENVIKHGKHFGYNVKHSKCTSLSRKLPSLKSQQSSMGHQSI